ncbi:alpha/beta fold hydrolase [Yunchengibacter salinarum]|uniref:alpha/beta fold hydrolase n=1 Tax=Yunchengibacter salinarum TaxID=3133399 RepID=UPI0035B671CE
MAHFDEASFTNSDGLSLHYRDYNMPPSPNTVICLPGLTRNARDFEALAERLSERARVICPDMRGRGGSQWDPRPERYAPPTYVADIRELMAHLSIGQAHFVGTSLGGILTMITAATSPGVVQTAILNDIGPHIEPAGIQRIQSYVGKVEGVKDWDAAVQACKTMMADAYPTFDDDDWRDFARSIFAERDGGPVLDYDPAIAENLNADSSEVLPDLWPVFEALTGIPTLALRGELSDILSAETLAAMERGHPRLTAVTVPDVGHAPTLKEPASVAAIEQFLEPHLK